jgi:hypothetical protein
MAMRTTKPAITKLDDLAPKDKEAIDNFINTGKKDKPAKKEIEPEVVFCLKLPKSIHRTLKKHAYFSEEKTTMNNIICDAIRAHLVNLSAAEDD